MAPGEDGQFHCVEEADCPGGWLCSPCNAKCYSDVEGLSESCDGGTVCGEATHTQCGDGNDVYWFDDCGNAFDVQTSCPDNRGICQNVDERVAQCSCQGNWNIADSCNACLDHWDIADNCNSCMGNWDKAKQCQACLAGYGDVDDDCGTCVRYVNGGLQIDDLLRDGHTWASALATVQEGIDAAAAAINDSDFDLCEVWVAAGEYPIYSDEYATVLLKPGVSVYGSFIAQTASRIDRGDWKEHQTVLNGMFDADNRVYHVVTGSDDATLDGFVITGGSASSEEIGDVLNKSGGGMLNNSASPTIRNCIFEENRAFDVGGAMYNTGGSVPAVENCTFRHNEANAGAAVFNDSSSAPFKNTFFDSNVATAWGGAMYNNDSSPLIVNSVFVHNEAGSRGGAVVNFSRSNAEFINCTIINNTTISGSAAIENRHSTSTPGSGSSIKIVGSILWGNTPLQVVNTAESVATITYSDVEGNCDFADGNICDSSTISEDPAFMEDGFGLKPDSPCIDQANGREAPAADILGKPRYDDLNSENATICAGEDPSACTGYADMGAYEYQGP